MIYFMVFIFTTALFCIGHVIYTYFYWNHKQFEVERDRFYDVEWNEVMNCDDRFDYVMGNWQRKYFINTDIKDIDDLIYEYLNANNMSPVCLYQKISIIILKCSVLNLNLILITRL